MDEDGKYRECGADGDFASELAHTSETHGLNHACENQKEGQMNLVHQRVRHNGCISYSTGTIATVIIVTEFCERIAFYGLGGSLVLFFQTRLGYSNAVADVQYSAWSGMCYVTPLIGGFVADSYLGRYNTIVLFATIYLGGLVLATLVAVPDYTHEGLVFLALYIIALGTGGIKPNVSTLGADQFDDRIEEEKEAKASFFSWVSIYKYI